MTKHDNPHDNPYWQEKRRDRDVIRILQGKPVSNSDFQVTRAPNVYILILKLFFTKNDIRRAIWRGFIDRLLHRTHQDEASQDNDFTKDINP
jgi:hypothetical protein